MCIVLSEDAVVELSKTPERLDSILATDDSVAVEIRRFEEGSSRHFSYCIVDMTREELYQHAIRVRKAVDKANAVEECLKCLEKLDIDNGIWYKYFEEKAATESSESSTKHSLKGNIMSDKTSHTNPNATEAQTEQPVAMVAKPVTNYWGMLKVGLLGLGLLGAGASAGYYAGKKAGVKACSTMTTL